MGWVIGIVGAWCGFTLVMVLLSWRRPELGIADGKLKPCGERPNCVCSHATDGESAIQPLKIVEARAAEFSRLQDLFSYMQGATLIEEGQGYLRFEFSTPVMRYVDDVEFLLDDAAGAIHVRSASRVGYSDMGANRERVETIRAKFVPPSQE